MTVAERLHSWNRWYDGLPQEWRFQIILWPLIMLGALNMLLSLSIRFPFGLLLLLGVLFVAAVRVPYSLGWITPAQTLPPGQPGAPKLEIGGAGADWIAGINERYEAVPEKTRFWIIPAILVVAGAINMQMTIQGGYPFGLLFLIVLLAVIVVRAPYVHGLLRPAAAAGMPAPALQYDARITDARAPAPTEAGSGAASSAPPAWRDVPASGPEGAKPSVVDPAPGPDRHEAAAMPSPPVPPRPEPAPDETDAARAPSPDLGLASGPGDHGEAVVSSPFAAETHPEPGGTDAAHTAAPSPKHLPGSQVE